MTFKNDPYLDAALRGWIVNTANRNFWRVAAWYSLEDLIQDGYLAYAKCRNRYTALTVKKHPLPEDKKQFMGLVQATYINHITNLANARTAGEDLIWSQMGEEGLDSETISGMAPVQPEEQSLRALLNNAPAELISLVELLSNEGKEAATYLRTRLRRETIDGRERCRLGRRKLRETTNEHLCRRLGIDPKQVDLRELVADYLGLSETHVAST